MKKMNHVIAAVIIMAITTAMPAMAGNKKHVNNGKKSPAVGVTHKKGPHFFNEDKRTARFDAHHRKASHPVVKTCAFKVSHPGTRHEAVARARHIHGVMDAYWNPRTHEMIVRYDARVTSARHIMHLMA